MDASLPVELPGLPIASRNFPADEYRGRDNLTRRPEFGRYGEGAGGDHASKSAGYLEL